MDEIMMEQPYKVLVRVDSAGRVAEINSSAFVQDASGWVKIDEGYGDSYHHAQGNYLDGPLMDERGVYRYKLVDGKVVERTQEEMDADYTSRPSPEPTNEELMLEMAADHEYRICLMELGVTENDL